MKHQVFAIIAILTFVGCSEDTPQAESIPQFFRIKSVSYYIRSNGDSISNGYNEYLIDSGFVTQVNSNVGTYFFAYDEQARLEKVTEGEETIAEVYWSNDSCHLKLRNGVIHMKYSNGNIVAIDNRRYEYAEDNVTAVYLDDELRSEYLNYNTSVIHPDFYLKSVEPWLAFLRGPLSKNICEIQRDQPYEGDDFFSGLYDYHYEYVILDRYRVKSIKPEWSVNTWHYEFYP